MPPLPSLLLSRSCSPQALACSCANPLNSSSAAAVRCVPPAPSPAAAVRMQFAVLLVVRPGAR